MSGTIGCTDFGTNNEGIDLAYSKDIIKKLDRAIKRYAFTHKVPYEKLMDCDFDIEPFDEVERWVNCELGKFNRKHCKEIDSYHSDKIVLSRKIDGELVAGLVADSAYCSFYVQRLFVSEEHRGKDLGKSLLEELELIAFSRGYYNIWVDTWDWQGVGFYEKCGYTEVYVMKNNPPSHTCHFYFKELKPSCK